MSCSTPPQARSRLGAGAPSHIFDSTGAVVGERDSKLGTLRCTECLGPSSEYTHFSKLHWLTRIRKNKIKKRIKKRMVTLLGFSYQRPQRSPSKKSQKTPKLYWPIGRPPSHPGEKLLRTALFMKFRRRRRLRGCSLFPGIVKVYPSDISRDLFLI